MQTLTSHDIRQAVREQYGKVAQSAGNRLLCPILLRR
jgi:hypothetical protein